MEQDIIEDTFINYKINKHKHECSVVNSPNALGDIFIPRSIMFESHEYLVTTIENDSFTYNEYIRSIKFPEDSFFNTIECSSFECSHIRSLYFPPSVRNLENGWCKMTDLLNHIIISPDNTSFRYADSDHKIIVGKSDPNQENYDELVFASRDVTNVMIPDYVKRIRPYAFECCSKLEKVEISPNSLLQEIGGFSFAETKIESLYLPKNVEKLDDCWCRRTFNLTNVIISDENKHFKYDIQNNIIVGKSDPAKELYDEIYFARRNIHSIKIPKYIKTIKSCAFDYCQHLCCIEFEKDSKLETIGDYSFVFTNMNAVVIPKSVSRIGKYCFAECLSLNSFKLEPNSKLESLSKGLLNNCRNLSNVEFPKNSALKRIEEYAFCNTIIYSLNLPRNFQKFEDGSLYLALSLSKLCFSPRNKYFKQTDKIIVRKSDIKQKNYDELVFAFPYISGELVIPRDIKQINSYAFFQNKFTDYVTFPKDSCIETICEHSFSYCLLHKIIIPSSVSYLGKSAFIDCPNLETVIIQENSKLQSILPYTFCRCYKLKEIKIPEKSLIKTIGKSFISETFVADLYIPSSVEKLDENWCETSNLKNITIGPNNKYFKTCDEDPNLIIGRSDKNNEIFDEIVFACHNIKNVIIPNYIKRIRSYAFDGCRKIETIEFQEDSKLERIGSNAFYICQKLKNVDFSSVSQLKTIGKEAFAYSNIEKIIIPKSVTTISKLAFDNCLELQLIEIGENVDKNQFNKNHLKSCKNAIIMIPNTSKK